MVAISEYFFSNPIPVSQFRSYFSGAFGPTTFIFQPSLWTVSTEVHLSSGNKAAYPFQLRVSIGGK